MAKTTERLLLIYPIVPFTAEDYEEAVKVKMADAFDHHGWEYVRILKQERVAADWVRLTVEITKV